MQDIQAPAVSVANGVSTLSSRTTDTVLFKEVGERRSKNKIPRTPKFLFIVDRRCEILRLGSCFTSQLKDCKKILLLG